MSPADADRAALYLDGAMSPDERAAFEREMETRPDLAGLVAQWRANDARLRAAFDLPLPADLAARLGLEASPAPVPVADLAAARAGRERRRFLPARWSWAAGGALAASLVAALALGLTSLRPEDPTRSEAFQVAMQQLPSRQAAPLSGGADVTPILSFADGDGRFCREFALGGGEPRIGIACRTGGRWTVEGLVAGSGLSVDDSAIRTAGGDSAALDPVYRRLDAGDPFDAARERRLIERGWPEKGAGRE